MFCCTAIDVIDDRRYLITDTYHSKARTFIPTLAVLLTTRLRSMGSTLLLSKDVVSTNHYPIHLGFFGQLEDVLYFIQCMLTDSVRNPDGVTVSFRPRFCHARF